MKNYVRNILIFVVTFSLVFGLCIIPSYAGENIDNKVIKLDSSITVARNDHSSSPYLKYLNNTGDNYLCVINEQYVVLTDNQSNTVFFGWGNSTYNPMSSGAQSTVNNDYGLIDYGLYRYAMFGYNDSQDLTGLTPFSDFTSAAEYLSDYIENPPLSSSNFENTYSLLNGYAIVFDLGSENQPYDIFVTQVQEHSSIGQFNNVKQTWGWSNTLPDTSTTFPRLSDTIIPYYKTGSDNIWGASDNGFSNKATMVANGFWNETTNSRYLTIYNPYAIPIEQSLKNGAGLQFYYPEPINITITGAISYKLISLRSGMTNTGVQGGYTSEETDTTTEEIDSNGALSPEINGKEPEKGGQNENPDNVNPIQSITGYLQNIQETLSNFANSFISLLQAPISHVRQLIAAGSEYFGVIRGLYGWLPDEVQGTINSAMIVSISVGVIALLL